MRGVNEVASLEKYNSQDIEYEIRHNTRDHPHPPSNQDIDPQRFKDNYSLAPSGMSAKQAIEYYHNRLKEVYIYGRKDVVVAAQWIVTLPQDLDPSKEREFFEVTRNFLNDLYGEKNCLQAIVHKDEGLKIGNQIVAGRPHLHYLFIPVIKNEKYKKANRYGNITGSGLYPEKLCANQLITKTHLQAFHEHFQNVVNRSGLKATVHSGSTNGKNRSVLELKNQTLRVELDLARTELIEVQAKLEDREKKLEAAIDEINDLRKRLNIDRPKETDISWGDHIWGDHSWGKEIDFKW